jgi:hypothetical protein
MDIYKQITKPNPAWHENPALKARYEIRKLTFGQGATICGVWVGRHDFYLDVYYVVDGLKKKRCKGMDAAVEQIVKIGLDKQYAQLKVA